MVGTRYVNPSASGPDRQLWQLVVPERLERLSVLPRYVEGGVSPSEIAFNRCFPLDMWARLAKPLPSSRIGLLLEACRTLSREEELRLTPLERLPPELLAMIFDLMGG